jgi:hypothetical protein
VLDTNASPEHIDKRDPMNLWKIRRHHHQISVLHYSDTNDDENVKNTSHIPRKYEPWSAPIG